MTEIKNRLDTLQITIAQCAREAKRPENAVQLLAVSKTWPAEKLRLAAEAGQIRFGENYLQEALIKISELSNLNLEWHFIGPIQSNKTKDIASHFDWVQSIDRLKVAQRLNDQRPNNLPPLNICIQLNIDNEQTKSGIAADSLFEFVEAIHQLDRLQLRGLMIIPTKTDNIEQQRLSFDKAYQLFEQLKSQVTSVDTLSMGMSADLQQAIAAGSTMVRVGTGLFGQRNTPKPQ